MYYTATGGFLAPARPIRSSCKSSETVDRDLQLAASHRMSLSGLRQFTYQRKSEYRSQRNYSCVEDAENDSVAFLLTPNKASLTSIPETPPSLQCTGSDTCRLECARRGERRKRYNRLSSSSEEEEDAKSKGDDVTSRKKVKSQTSVTIFSRLPASKRKKRILKDDSDNKEEEVAEFVYTKETS